MKMPPASAKLKTLKSSSDFQLQNLLAIQKSWVACLAKSFSCSSSPSRSMALDSRRSIEKTKKI